MSPCRPYRYSGEAGQTRNEDIIVDSFGESNCFFRKGGEEGLTARSDPEQRRFQACL